MTNQSTAETHKGTSMLGKIAAGENEVFNNTLLATILGNNPNNSSACDDAEESGKVPGYQSTNH